MFASRGVRLAVGQNFTADGWRSGGWVSDDMVCNAGIQRQVVISEIKTGIAGLHVFQRGVDREGVGPHQSGGK